MDVSYDYYRIFYYVAKYGSISQAAKVLMRGQPNVTKAMQNLEEQLGCKLFSRTSRGVLLTPEGEKLYGHLAIAFEHISAAEGEILSELNLESGTVSVAVTEVALYGALLSVLRDFSKAYPKVRVKLINYNNRRAMDMMKSGLVDFAVLSMRDDTDSSYKLTTIRTFREILCIRSDIAHTAGLEAIGEHLYICCNSSTYVSKFCQIYLMEQGVTREPDVEVATSNQVLQLVKAGVGVGFVSEPLAKPYLDSGEIIEIPLTVLPLEREICLVEDKSRRLSAAARKLITYLRC